MKHKWHKEIKAWADGEKIEVQSIVDPACWLEASTPQWQELFNYRIKSQPKEPQYLYAYQGRRDVWISETLYGHAGYIGKIKLEVDDV
jgi:hypothetical protein